MNMFRAFGILSGICLAMSACGGSGGNGAVNADMRPAPGYAYIVTSNPTAGTPGTVYQYTVGSDGSFAALSPATITAGPDPRTIVSNPSGHFVYVVNGDATISQYAVGAGGELTALSPANVNIEGPNPYPYSATVDPTGRFLYVVSVSLGVMPSSESYIAEYAIGTAGQLTPLGGPGYITVPIRAAGALAIDSGGKHAYLAGWVLGSPPPPAPIGNLAQFSIADDGTLAALSPATVTTSGSGNGIAIHGQTAYLLTACVDGLTCDGQVTEYTIQSDGSLGAPGANTITGSHVIPITLLTNASGSAAYLLTNLMGVDTNMGAVYQYSINSTGGLTPASPASLGVASASVAEVILGSALHILSSNDVVVSGAQLGGHVDHYDIGADGLLSFVSTTSVAAGGFPQGMTLVVVQ
jgi:6-phosphogluconolactonase (cycloisomerase 2 family)